MLYAVLIEWDGKVPPSQYYHRLHKLAPFRVRGNKDISVLTRRAQSTDQGVIFQEGAVVVPTESLARMVALLATEHGAAAVKFGTIELNDEFQLTPEDETSLARIEAVFGRRGRPGEKLPWVVTCLEEGKTYATTAPAVANCPHCGSMLITVRQGEPVTIQLSPALTLYGEWLERNFQAGVFEEALVTNDPTAPSSTPLPGPTNPTEHTLTLDLANLSNQLDASGINRSQGLRILTAIFISRSYFTAERQLEARLRALQAHFRSGGTPNGTPLMTPDHPDIFDAGAVLTANEVAGIARRLHSQEISHA